MEYAGRVGLAGMSSLFKDQDGVGRKSRAAETLVLSGYGLVRMASFAEDVIASASRSVADLAVVSGLQ